MRVFIFSGLRGSLDWPQVGLVQRQRGDPQLPGRPLCDETSGQRPLTAPAEDSHP